MVSDRTPSDLGLDETEHNFKKLLHTAKESCI